MSAICGCDVLAVVGISAVFDYVCERCGCPWRGGLANVDRYLKKPEAEPPVRASTPAERYEAIKHMLNPADGSPPLISRANAIELLGDPPARVVRVGDLVTWGAGAMVYPVWLVRSDGVRVRVLADDAPYTVTWDANGVGALRHADGAPIDIEASLAAAKVPDLPADHGERLRVAAKHREQAGPRSPCAECGGDLTAPSFWAPCEADRLICRDCFDRLEGQERARVRTFADQLAVDACIAAHQARIESLEVQLKAAHYSFGQVCDARDTCVQRASSLGDRCGDLQRERDEARAEVGRLTIENAKLRRGKR